MKHLKKLLATAFAIASLLMTSSRTDAALMVYEGFNGYNTSISLIGQTPNANSIGLDQTSAWISSNSQQTLLVSGLSFGSGATQLEVSGGAIQRQNSASTSASAKFNIAGSNFSNGQSSGQFVGTMYSSYLVQVTGTGSGLNHNAHVVVFNGSSSGSRRFRSGAATDAGNVVGIDYVGSEFVAGSGNINVNNETFMILSRYTRVGQTINGANPGVGTLWALTSDQFNYFKANDWAGIDSATVGAGSMNVWAKASETHTASTANNTITNALYWTAGSGSTAANNNVKFDELRMGTSFDDVTPVVPFAPEVPEPSSIALVVLGLAGAGFARRVMKK